MTPQQFIRKFAFASPMAVSPPAMMQAAAMPPAVAPPAVPAAPQVSGVGQAARTVSKAAKPLSKTTTVSPSASGIGKSMASAKPSKVAEFTKKLAYGNIGGFGVPTAEKPKPKVPPGPNPKLLPGGKLRPKFDLSDPKQFGKAAAENKLAFGYGTVIGGLGGAFDAPKGHRMEGIGRGAARGLGWDAGGTLGGVAGGGLGGATGAGLGALIAALSGQNVGQGAAAGGLAGLPLGGIAGYLGGGWAGQNAMKNLRRPASYYDENGKPKPDTSKNSDEPTSDEDNSATE